MGNKKLAKALNKRIDATRSVLAGRAVNLQKQIDRIERDVEPVIEEHNAREHRRDGLAARVAKLEAQFRPDGMVPGRRAIVETVDRLERRLDRQPDMVGHRLERLELFQRRAVLAGYAAGLVGGTALVVYVARFVVALCQ